MHIAIGQTGIERHRHRWLHFMPIVSDALSDGAYDLFVAQLAEAGYQIRRDVRRN
jgi:hypothetical protein